MVKYLEDLLGKEIAIFIAKTISLLFLVGLLLFTFSSLVVPVMKESLFTNHARDLTTQYVDVFIDDVFGGVLDEDCYSVVTISGGPLGLSTKTEITLNNNFFVRFQSFLEDKGYSVTVEDLRQLRNAGLWQSQLRRVI